MEREVRCFHKTQNVDSTSFRTEKEEVGCNSAKFISEESRLI